MMLYAKVILGLPVDGPFDYIIPQEFISDAKIGSRVWVNFRNKKELAYIVGLTKVSRIKKLKSIIKLVDTAPIISKHLLLLAKELSLYYCCSWGEAVEIILPQSIRKGRILPGVDSIQKSPLGSNKEIILIHGPGFKERLPLYLESIKECISEHQSAILLLPDIKGLGQMKAIIESELKITPLLLLRSAPKEALEWDRARQSEAVVVLGTRSSVFAPVNNLGLIIIEEEESTVYKQDQTPHYHARVAAFLRAKLEGAKLILGSSAPSLESMELVRKNKIKYEVIERKKEYPQVRLVDLKTIRWSIKKNIIFSSFLREEVYSVLNSGGKILFFLNRLGFATIAACHNCGKVLKCPHCQVNLNFHFAENQLICHYCNFKMPSPKICPECNSGYIKFFGGGTERLESEIVRMFPGARVLRIEETEVDKNKADIFIATSIIFKHEGLDFGLIGVLGIDNALNRFDFRSTEKTYQELFKLLNFTAKKLVIETRIPHHYLFKSLFNKDAGIFYDEELKERRQLKLPPFSHLALVRVRCSIEEKAQAAGKRLFEFLSQKSKGEKGIDLLSLNPGQPAKLRGNFYWQVLISTGNVLKLNKFLKLNLKSFAHSGIIVTVDIDPV